MSVTAFSIADGDIIKASDADYETYCDKLPVCGTCFGEICLACGEHKRTYWRHFPGVSIDCPDRSNIKSVVYKSIKHTNRKQSLALFRQRFLEILDFGIQPTFVGLSDTPQKLSFREPMMYNIARLLPITCNDRKASFDTVIFEIYRKHRKRTDIITGLVDIAINNLYNDDFINIEVDYELKKQIGQITKQYLDIQTSSAQLASQYVFTPGKENILISLMSYCWILHKSQDILCNYVDLPSSLMVICTSLLGAIPWHHICSALIEKRTPQNCPINNTSYLVSNEGLAILTSEFNKPMPKRKVQGFKRIIYTCVNSLNR
ncbi:hypothetical protein NIES2101_39880 [Calothrix sp. HK-06]|nr:hypothetical protein NIES2101_39880 [Calothrix sp. HK-06]